ncbi:uncharacterized protein [Physcomitrium patens]|uniref:M23ase beta-sheet core domain-containing protein n=1 Tax=Physcomitrium patens TaxID=3218 RepID=A9SYC0_PHYPA|nr:uncharacterized protein LOC112284793 [Physcomitrium patens]PNR50602.1 hypothetical protein PHYPA_009788 [Physcomitrium patens]|eukprot:XP_024380799.1 uncharacterized protein LOC112284793 [Physcomitrella patens]
MGITFAFCARFRSEELGTSQNHGFSGHVLERGLGCGGMSFEYASRRRSLSYGLQRLGKKGSPVGGGPAFAHIGKAFGNPLDGKGGPAEVFENFANAAQDVVKRAEHFLGLGKRPLDVELSSWTPAKGETIAVLVSIRPRRDVVEGIARFLFRKDPQPEAKVQIFYDGCEIPVFPTAADDKILRALVPTTPLTTPGPRTLKVEVADGRHETFEGCVEVMEKEYPVESIWLSKTKSKLRGTTMEKEKVGAFTATVSENQIWNGPFILPSDGEITTGYGMQRFYNGVFANHYYHRGVDYGAWEGDPVKAPANGRVLLVGKESDGYEIHGNCVGLDHGHGVTSIMMHLNSSFVKEGEMVNAGQIIGTVGETGIATGPHLHWGLHVRGEAIDPHPWMQAQRWI